MLRQLGAPEIILILLVVVLLFGAKKLPDLARGSGRALRIFKSETKGLMDDDDSTEKQRDELDTRREQLPESSAPTRADETPEESMRRLRGDSTS